MSRDRQSRKKYASVAWVSFASGLPLLLVGSTLQAWFTTSGISLMSIGLLSLVGFPYLLKFLWSPVIDRVSWGRFGRRKGWMTIMQVLLCVSLFVMSFFSPTSHILVVASLALVVAFFSATQDVAVDAYRTDLLTLKERGHGSAVTNIAFRAAMMVAGFLALFIAAETNWHVMYAIMAVLMLFLAVGGRFISNPKGQPVGPKNMRSAVVEPMKNFWQRFGTKEIILLVLFVLFYKFSDALALSLNTTFLLRALGFSLLTVGSVAKITSTVAILLGSVTAGFLMPRMSLYRSLWWFGWLQLISTLGFCVLSIVGHNVVMMAAVMFIDFFCGGLGSVAFVVLLMTLCNKQYSATQYALLSALAAVTRVIIGPISAIVVQHVGWLDFYVIAFLLGIPIMGLLFSMRGQIDRIEGRMEPVDEISALG